MVAIALKNMVKRKDKLQFTQMWFGRNLSCLFVVRNLTLYPPEVRSVKIPQHIFVKNMAKYVILLHFCVSLLQKHKKT